MIILLNINPRHNPWVGLYARLDENSIDILLSRILRGVMIQIQTNGGRRYQSLNIILYNITITRNGVDAYYLC